MNDRYKFLKVGCADTTILCLGSKIIMIDTYQSDDSDKEDIVKRLPGKKVDLLIITHQHYDHFLELEYLLEKDIDIAEIWGCPYSRRHGDLSVEYDEWNKYKSLIEKAKNKGASYYKLYRSDKTYTRGGATFQILNPATTINSRDGRELHDASLVIHISKGNDTLLFCGDASDSALDEVMSFCELEKVHILHASHHGSLNGANLAFIKKVSPDYTIISTESGVYENVPHSTALARYREHTKKAVRRTDTDGSSFFLKI